MNYKIRARKMIREVNGEKGKCQCNNGRSIVYAMPLAAIIIGLVRVRTAMAKDEKSRGPLYDFLIRKGVMKGEG